MRTICALCGRKTMPAVYIGNEAIGPKCAKRAGLLVTKITKGSRLRFMGRYSNQNRDPKTIDMFDN